MTTRRVTKNTHFLTWLWFAQPKYDQKSIKNRPKNVKKGSNFVLVHIVELNFGKLLPKSEK